LDSGVTDLSHITAESGIHTLKVLFFLNKIPHILNIDTRWRKIVSFKLSLVYPCRKILRMLWDRGHISQPLPGIESWSYG
jgi:hypothetical protein